MIRQKWASIIMSVITVLTVASCSKNDNAADSGPDKPKIHPITDLSKAYVDTVFDFMPAPGQFINTGFADLATVSKITKNETISLGAWGGYVVLGFDHTVVNNVGADILIKGNGTSTSAEPGIVWVSFDANGNGKPDDPWFELKGSAYNAVGYERNYKVTYYKPVTDADNVMWVDNHKDTGYIEVNSSHKQAYYPAWITAENYTLNGSLLPSSGIDDSNPSFITSTPFEYGYADNNAVASGGDSLDIGNAIDTDGTEVKLIGIDFIKIQTGVMRNMGWVGELSTEVSSVGDLNML